MVNLSAETFEKYIPGHELKYALLLAGKTSMNDFLKEVN